MRSLAIGDIHGCHGALAALLARVEPAADDELIFIGDYIDRGPNSHEVLDTLIELKQRRRCVFLRGNHEVMVLGARDSAWKADLWRSAGGAEMLQSYGVEFGDNWAVAIPEAHWRFLEATVRYHETAGQIFVHGCAAPDVEMADQPDWMLFWEKFDRLKPHKSGKRVVCGHTPQRSGIPRNAGFAVCIDTRPLGGWLTCLDAGTDEYWQASEKGETRTGRLGAAA